MRSEWLSECLRVGSLQPFESHVLDTITPATVSKFAKRNTAAAAATARSAAGGTGLSGLPKSIHDPLLELTNVIFE